MLKGKILAVAPKIFSFRKRNKDNKWCYLTLSIIDGKWHFWGETKGENRQYGGVTLPYFRTTFDTLLTIDFSLSFVCQLQTKEVPDKRYGLHQSSKACREAGRAIAWLLCKHIPPMF